MDMFFRCVLGSCQGGIGEHCDRSLLIEVDNEKRNKRNSTNLGPAKAVALVGVTSFAVLEVC